MTQIQEAPVTDPEHLMHTLDRTGDTKVSWDPDNAAEVTAARASFDALKAKGYLAYRTTREGVQTGAQIREFDPEAKRIVLVKQIVGG